MAWRISRAITISHIIAEKTSEPARIQPSLTSEPKKNTSAVEIPRTHTRHEATSRIKALEGWNEEINVYEISRHPVLAKLRNITRSRGGILSRPQPPYLAPQCGCRILRLCQWGVKLRRHSPLVFWCSLAMRTRCPRSLCGCRASRKIFRPSAGSPVLLQQCRSGE